MCRSAALQLQPLWIKQNRPPICHSERTVVSRGIFPSGLFYLVVVHYSTWWIPPLRLRYGRNDRTGGRLYGFAYCFWNVSGPPLPHQSGLRPASFPGGEAFVPGFGVPGVIGNGSVLSRAERHIGRSLHTLTDESKWATLVAPIIVNYQLAIVNSDRTVNCPLSTPPKIVNCQLIIPFAQKARRKRNGGPF